MVAGAGRSCHQAAERNVTLLSLEGEVRLRVRGQSQQEDQEGPGCRGHEEGGDGDQEAHGRPGGFALSPGPSAPASVTPKGPPKL